MGVSDRRAGGRRRSSCVGGHYGPGNSPVTKRLKRKKKVTFVLILGGSWRDGSSCNLTEGPRYVTYQVARERERREGLVITSSSFNPFCGRHHPPAASHMINELPAWAGNVSYSAENVGCVT